MKFRHQNRDVLFHVDATQSFGKLVDELRKVNYDMLINGETTYSIPSTLNICISGVTSEALMLSTRDFCGISNGSACNSKSYNPSYVLLAMGISREQIENSIRVSWGPDVELDKFEKSFQNIIETARRLIW